jgi:hypothetical protein
VADNQTAAGFGIFGDPSTGQTNWNNFYSRAYLRMSLFGVNNINKLTDCTQVLPSFLSTFSGTGTGLNPQCSSGSPTSAKTWYPSVTPSPEPGSCDIVTENVYVTEYR